MPRWGIFIVGQLDWVDLTWLRILGGITVNAMHAASYEKLQDYCRESALLESVTELLGWDEQTKMPARGAPLRADQSSLMAGLVHARQTDPRIGECLAELRDSPLADDPHSDEGATIRQLGREYEKNLRLPQELVEQLARMSVVGQQTWVEARRADDYGRFAPILEQIVALCREKADALGWEECRYDALLDEYEPEAKTSEVRQALEPLGDALVTLLEDVVGSGREPPASLLQREYPVTAQESLGLAAARLIGFDFGAGRLDVAAHPFCCGLGPGDCRITTRYDQSYWPTSFFGILHETGHGLYEQGLRQDQFGLPPGRFASLGIHESQSRLWENQVGRGRPFWQHFYPIAQQTFSAALGDVPFDDFYGAINRVRPSLIRVEADEVTYNLHILIRFELEQALINGELDVANLPEAWNQQYREKLGIGPTNDADGVLQDIHWSGGMIGYFSTYSLGNMYAAQIFDAIHSEIGDLDTQMGRGDFGELLRWLRAKVHAKGQCYNSQELVHEVTGRPATSEPLLNYLRGKIGPLYRL